MWEKTLAEFLMLAGFAALVAVIINILKIVKIKGVPIVQEDTAPKWSAGFNLAGLLALYIFRLFRPDLPVTGVDAILMEIATVGTYILAFVSQLQISKFANSAVRGIPIIGKSFSLDREIAMRKQYGETLVGGPA